MRFLRNADIAIEGKDENGERLQLTGKVQEVEINDVPDMFGGLNAYQTYYLKFVTDSNGVAYRIKKELKDVIYTARIEVDKLTVQSLEYARERAGVPTHAEFNIINDRPSNQVTFGTSSIVVEFRWVDKA